MTTTENSTLTAMEMARIVTDALTKSVEEGADPAEARAKIADFLSGYTGPVGDTAKEAVIPAPEDLILEEEFVLRPNGEKYFTRKLGNHTDIAVMRSARVKGIPILMYGMPGTGKTAAGEAAFSDDVIVFSGTGDTEVADLVGGYVQMPDGTYRWIDGPLLVAMKEGRPLLVDEIALIDPKVLAILYAAMDGRGEILVTSNPDIGIVKAQEGFYVLGACNPNAPGAQMSEALLSRFPLQFEVGTDYKLAKSLGVPAKMVTVAQNLQKRVEKGELGWAPQLRELLNFKKIQELLGEDVALRNVVSTAPDLDRAIVLDVVSRTFSKRLTTLTVD